MDIIEKKVPKVENSLIFTKNTQKIYVMKVKNSVNFRILFIFLLLYDKSKNFLYEELMDNLSSFMIEILLDKAKDKLKKKMNNNKTIEGLIFTE